MRFSSPHQTQSQLGSKDDARRKTLAKLKTTQNENSVRDFLNSVQDEDRRKDCFTIVRLMKAATRAEPKMWGAAIVGFGVHRLHTPVVEKWIGPLLASLRARTI